MARILTMALKDPRLLSRDRFGLFWVIAYLLVLPISSFAGWSDHAPVPINSVANPGAVNPHANSGGRRIVRISGTTISIAPHGSGERTYRSTDNGHIGLRLTRMEPIPDAW